MMITDFKQESIKMQGNGWDSERLGGFEEHLRNLGVSF